MKEIIIQKKNLKHNIFIRILFYCTNGYDWLLLTFNSFQNTCSFEMKLLHTFTNSY